MTEELAPGDQIGLNIRRRTERDASSATTEDVGMSVRSVLGAGTDPRPVGDQFGEAIRDEIETDPTAPPTDT